MLLSPPILVEAVAGLALLAALAGAVSAAVAAPDTREAAVVTFVVTASGVSLLGVGGAFWGLLAGWLMLLLFRRRPAVSEAPADRPETAEDRPLTVR
ncbi:benzoate/H(+) symporter BenE family transporter [Micromonospora sp. R77]|uniref:benzoate/H(+) symporter BenE family transporter n=1 Tax=Micromonospora sp. R77 TaxID=2925836 RepID=UPI0027E054AF|nr:benzoate/H(+) symporter BenE family transporter [Micromonospora sp. R77]